jgi:hypothetical protein
MAGSSVKRTWIALLVIVMVAAAARFHGLAAKSLWLDESLSWRLQSFPTGMLIARTGESTTVHPPLYFLLLRQWTYLAGDSEFSLRMLSAGAGVLTVLAMFFFVYELMRFWAGAGRPASEDACYAGLLACAVLAVNAFHVQLAQQVRGYTLGTLLAVLTGLLLLRALRLGSARAWVLYALAALAFCYTHTLALFSLAAQGYFAVIFLLPSGSAGGSRRASAWKGAGLAAVIVIAGYLPWVPNVFSQSETLRTSWTTRSLGIQDHVNEIHRAVLSTPATRGPEMPVLAWCVVVVLGAALAFGLARRDWAGLYLVCLSGIPLLLIFLYSQFSDRGIFSARYFAFAQPAWLAALACAVVRVPLGVERIVLAAMLVVWSAFSYVEAYADVGPERNPGMRAAAAWIVEHRRDDELVVSQTPFEFFKLAYYLRGSSSPPLLYVKEPRREKQRGTAQLVDSDLATREEIFRRQPQGLWIVTSNSFAPPGPTRIDLPEGWEVVEEREFAQDFWLERPLLVRHCRWKSGIAGVGEAGVEMEMAEKQIVDTRSGPER